MRSGKKLRKADREEVSIMHEKKLGDLRWSDPGKLAEAETGYETNSSTVIEFHNIVYALNNLDGIIWQRTDNGEKDWTPPVHLISPYFGVNGFMSLVVDGNDELNLFFRTTHHRIPRYPWHMGK